MKTYQVRWEMDIEADSPEEAAMRALIVQRDRDEANASTVFEVRENVQDVRAGWCRVDLGETTAEQAEEKVKGGGVINATWIGDKGRFRMKDGRPVLVVPGEGKKNPPGIGFFAHQNPGGKGTRDE